MISSLNAENIFFFLWSIQLHNRSTKGCSRSAQLRASCIGFLYSGHWLQADFTRGWRSLRFVNSQNDTSVHIKEADKSNFKISVDNFKYTNEFFFRLQIESKGPRFELGDFVIKLGSVTMSQNLKGVMVEVRIAFFGWCRFVVFISGSHFI